MRQTNQEIFRLSRGGVGEADEISQSTRALSGRSESHFASIRPIGTDGRGCRNRSSLHAGQTKPRKQVSAGAFSSAKRTPQA